MNEQIQILQDLGVQHLAPEEILPPSGPQNRGRKEPSPKRSVDGAAGGVSGNISFPGPQTAQIRVARRESLGPMVRGVGDDVGMEEDDSVMEELSVADLGGQERGEWEGGAGGAWYDGGSSWLSPPSIVKKGHGVGIEGRTRDAGREWITGRHAVVSPPQQIERGLRRRGMKLGMKREMASGSDVERERSRSLTPLDTHRDDEVLTVCCRLFTSLVSLQACLLMPLSVCTMQAFKLLSSVRTRHGVIVYS